MGKLKNILSLALAFTICVSVVANIPAMTSNASENSQTSIVVSDSIVNVNYGETRSFTVAFPNDEDARRVYYEVQDPSIATVTCIAYAGNVAAFNVTYESAGSTLVAIMNLDNTQNVAYVFINTSGVYLIIPSKLGTNKDNYCKLVSFSFTPYEDKYGDFNDFKYVLNLQYVCASYEDKDYNKWGCYATFYDAYGKAITKVHLYASQLVKSKLFESEFKVPKNAVYFEIEGLS